MKISYNITQKDLRAFISHLFTQISQDTGLKKKGLILLIIMFTLSAIEQRLPSIVTEIVFGFVFLWFSVNMIYSISRSRHLIQYLLTESHGITCGEHELECRNGMIIERTLQHEIRRSWNQVSSIEEGTNHVGLIMKTPPCVWLPKHAFTSQEELAAFLQHARNSTASATKEVPEVTRSHYSRQQIQQGLHYIWKKQFWVIPVLLSMLGIVIYHYQEMKRTPVETSSGFTERQDNKGQSYFMVLPEYASGYTSGDGEGRCLSNNKK